MHKILNKITNSITDESKNYGYLFTSDAPEVSPFNSKYIGASITNNVRLELKRKVLQGDIETNIHFLGCFKPDNPAFEVEYHYFIANEIYHTKETCIILKAYSSDKDKDVFNWSIQEIKHQENSLFMIKDFEVSYEEILNIYFFNPESFGVAQTFNDFVENNESFILSRL